MLDANTIALLDQLGINVADMESLLRSALLFTGLAVLAAVPTAIIARRKRRSRGLWLVFALSIPVIPLFLVWLLPPAQRTKE